MTSETIKILIIDDDPGDFQMAKGMIVAIEHPAIEYDVEWASSYEEAVEAFGKNEHDVYFVDYFLEDRDGLDVVREARALGVRQPLIMLTGRGSHEVDLKAMEAGASDYLVKGQIDPHLMERTVRYALERFRSQEALRESDERHRGMFDHLPIGLYRCSLEGDFKDANPALLRMLGRPEPEVLRERYAAHLFVAPADVARFRELLETAGIARGFETTLDRLDGTTVLVKNTARAHREQEGAIEYIEGAVEDVTELQSAERLRGSAERFETVYHQSHLPILLVDGQALVIDGNPAFRRAFGYPGPDLGGRAFETLVAEADRPPLRREIRALTAGESDHIQGERRFVDREGTLLWARMHASLIRDAEGGPGHIMILFEEVAEAG